MDPASLVLIDTCLWVPFFARKDSPPKAAITSLLDDDRAAVVGPVVAEILLGFKRDAQADWVASALEGVHYCEVQWDDWRAAAQLGRELLSRGHNLPLTDLTLAVVARRHSCWVYTIDPHFDLIQGLKRFEPG